MVVTTDGLHREDGQVRLTEDHSRVVAVFEDIPAIAIHDLDHVLIAGHWMLASHPGCSLPILDAEGVEGEHDPLPLSDSYNPRLAMSLLVGPGNLP